MIIREDADIAMVVSETVAALEESTRHIGKADRAMTSEQIAVVETAMDELRKALESKGR
ncbi:hypothetical protein [uncultured Enterovirga sp.]|uniref:hypothetical protein n=1 Tax=uncultured Enterovirga sp. TaxID=2026352 RepID=UPI0035CBDC2E